MITDLELDQRLNDLRPDAHWSADERADVLEQVLAAERQARAGDRHLISARPPRRRRTLVLAGTAGLAAAACIAAATVLPAGSPGGPSRADAAVVLHHLATVAAADPVGEVGPTQFVHLVDVGHQAASPGQPSSDSRYEFWIRPDGLTYQKRMSRSSDGLSENDVWLNGPGPQVVDGMTEPVYLDSLPTDPTALNTFLQDHTTGSSSPEERIFVAAADIVRRAVAGPALRAAAIDVLAGLGHVQLTGQTHDSMGNAVRAFQFVDESTRPDDRRVIMFDTRTAQITEELDYFHGEPFVTTTVPEFEIVDTVPVAVQRAAVRQR